MADTWVELCEFAEAKEAWLKTLLPLPNNLSSHDTSARSRLWFISEKPIKNPYFKIALAIFEKGKQNKQYKKMLNRVSIEKSFKARKFS